MSKLFKLKEWLAVPDAAQHLSGVFGEPVTEADVLRLGLDGHLKLSVNFVNHTNARLGIVVPLDRALVEFHPKEFGARAIVYVRQTDPLPADLLQDVQQGNVRGILSGMPLDAPPTRVLELAHEVSTIRGVWDLPMIGAESLDVEHAFQQLTGGPEVTLMTLDGAFVESSDGTLAQLQDRFDSREMVAMNKGLTERLTAAGAKIRPAKDKNARPANDPNNYFPAGGIPPDAPLVVRTSALADFITRTAETESGAEPKKESTRERNTLLRLIGIMAHQKYSTNIDEPYTIAGHVERMAAELGIDISKQTIANHIITALDLTKKTDRTS